MDFSFRLRFAFACPCVVLDKHMSSLSAGFFFLRRMCVHVHNTMTHFNKRNTNQQAGWKMLTKKNSNKRNSLYKSYWHLFRPRPQLLSHIWHPFVTPVAAPCSAPWYARKGRDLSILAADSGFHFSPCAMRFIESRLHDVLLGKPRNFIIPASSNFIVVAPLHIGSIIESRRRSSGLRLRPKLHMQLAQGQVSLAG